jgi:hypothetical protein
MKFSQVVSSNIAEAGYDGTSKVQIKFKGGGVYEYEGIEPEVWREFEKTFQSKDSSGKFFLQHIKKDKFRKL